MGVHDVYYSRRHRLGFLSRSLSPRVPDFGARFFFFRRRRRLLSQLHTQSLSQRKLQTLLQTLFTGHCVGRCYPPAPTCLHGGYDVAALALFPALGTPTAAASADFGRGFRSPSLTKSSSIGPSMS